MIERGGEVVIRMLPDVKQRTIKPLITETVEPGSTLMTDEYDIYARLLLSQSQTSKREPAITPKPPFCDEKRALSVQSRILGQK